MIILFWFCTMYCAAPIQATIVGTAAATLVVWHLLNNHAHKTGRTLKRRWSNKQ